LSSTNNYASCCIGAQKVTHAEKNITDGIFHIRSFSSKPKLSELAKIEITDPNHPSFERLVIWPSRITSVPEKLPNEQGESVPY
jgi:hypothetical protein